MSYQSCGFAVSTLGFVHFGLTKSKMPKLLCRLDLTFHGVCFSHSTESKQGDLMISQICNFIQGDT